KHQTVEVIANEMIMLGDRKPVNNTTTEEEEDEFPF
ncbi:MAG: single-stranded DNA-binding protein, partial [candidate division Zixibacteria bacterium]|nr:single-stranded DNA-binding protein [candidate division Zixibacteria bacterium]